MSVCACQTHQILHLKWMHFILCKLYLSKVDLEKILSPSPLKIVFCVLFSSKQFQDSFNITMIIAKFLKMCSYLLCVVVRPIMIIILLALFY